MVKFASLAAAVAVSTIFCSLASPPGANARAQDSNRAVTTHQFFVSPSASANGDGSMEKPWPLQVALNQPETVKPGDTIWLRGGVYSGTFTGRLVGNSTSPIIVRQYIGERATIDGGNSNGGAIFAVQGSYSWYWGFEVMSSDPTRFTTDTGSSPASIPRGEGVLIDQSSPHPGLKFINMAIHDTRQGVSFWKEAQDSEVYGCLIYYNGWEAPDRGHGHGLYIQNQIGTKKVTDNILFSGFSHGIHTYGSAAAFLDNIDLEGNATFNSGDLSASGGRNLLFGGSGVAHNPIVSNNYIYRLSSGPGSDFDLGYSGGCENATVTNNYVSTSSEFANCSPTDMTGNTFFGSLSGFTQSQYPGNTYYSDRPAGVKVFVRPNTYEPGRANVTVFNWNLTTSVDVDLSAVLTLGDGYEVRAAQDFFGAPVLTGTYSGGALTLPLKGLSVASPVGHPAPPPSGPEFNAFVVMTTTSSRQTPRVVAPRPATPPRTLEQRPRPTSTSAP